LSCRERTAVCEGRRTFAPVKPRRIRPIAREAIGSRDPVGQQRRIHTHPLCRKAISQRGPRPNTECNERGRAMEDGLVSGEDGQLRCWWGASTADYAAYHDHEWGRPVADDARLLEKLVLEGFQSGLSWLTILRKREAFRAAFAGFDPPTLARY